MKKSSKNVLAIVISVVLVVSMAVVVMISAFADNAASEAEGVTKESAEEVVTKEDGTPEEPATDEDVTDEPEEPATDEDVTDEPEEPATDEPEEPATDEPVEPATDEPVEPATDEPEEPATKTDEPTDPSEPSNPSEPSETSETPVEPGTSEPDGPQYTEVGIVGDINKDGKVNSKDARLALRFSARLEAPTDEQLVLADADGDKIVRSRDARLILRVAAKLDKWGENGNIIGSMVKGLLVGGQWGYTVEDDFVPPTAAPTTVAPTEPTTAA